MNQKFLSLQNWRLISLITLIVSLILLLTIIYWPQQQNNNLLIAGTNSGFPPFEALDEQGNIVGFDIDIAQLLAKKLGKQLKLEDMSFDALIFALQQGKIDCAIAGISITQRRKQEIALIHYSGKPLTELPLVFWGEIPSEVKTIDDLKHLANKTICTQTGTLQQEIIAQYQGIDLKYLENIPDLIMDIKYGKSIATVLEPKVAYALQIQFAELKILTMPIKPELQDFGHGIGINKTNEELIHAVRKIIAELKNDGTLETLETKWFCGGPNDK